MENLELGQANCYNFSYKSHSSKNLIITFTPSKGFFLYNNDLNAHKIFVSLNQPNYYIFNPGNASKRLAEYIKTLNVENIIIIGSSKAGFASLLWGELIYRILADSHKIFVLSFSPQTLLYPFNERLYFPSYNTLMNLINSNEGTKRCAESYGDINKVLAETELKGMIVYPNLNPCDKTEAERVTAKNIKLIGLDYPLHGSFLPFMKQVKEPIKLQEMVKKIYLNAKNDLDITATIPESEEKLLELVSAINVPTIEELCQAIFFNMNSKDELDNFHNVKKLGFI